MKFEAKIFKKLKINQKKDAILLANDANKMQNIRIEHNSLNHNHF